MKKFSSEHSSEMIKRVQNGDMEAQESFINENMGLVRSIATRFLNRGAEFEDLCQIGAIGMLKAVRNFDFSHGTMFSTYAVPLIMGEIKKFLRDDGMIKVSRELKRKSALLLRARESFMRENGREPRVSELAEICKITPEEVAEGFNAPVSIMSLSEPVGESSLEDFIGGDNINELCESIALRQAVAALPEQERKIVFYRFFKGFSQAKTGDVLGLTQVKISRTEKKIIEKLREKLS